MRRRPARPPRRRAIVPLLVSLALASGLVAGQERQPPAPGQDAPPAAEAPPQPTFRVEANYVRVDVIATEDGVPVDDLVAGDFEVLEDKVPQEVATFEHVQVRPAGAQVGRMEPNTVRESREMAGNPRSRVFVLFLDTYHVSNESSHRVRGPIVQMLDRLIGPEDLVGVMTPEMSAADISLARKTDTIEGMLTKYWPWGKRSDLERDPMELEYEQCYPDVRGSETEGLAHALIERRREKLSLDATVDLVRYLQTLRDERKAILMFSEGWLLFRPDERMAARVGGSAPGPPGVFVGPDGRITTQADPRNPNVGSAYQCEVDRQQLALIDNDHDFRRMLDEANRANTSFYPVDPRGLPVFDRSMDRPLPIEVDAAVLRNRIETLRTMADATDGLAVVNTNDLDAGLRRVVNDLSSYYLLGYYASNSKLDGTYRTIAVRVKRPGLEVRARRGYRAATEAEVTAARAAPPPDDPAAADRAVVTSAIESLASTRVDLPFRLYAVVNGTPHPDAAGVWVVGELDPRTARQPEWAQGGSIAVMVGDEAAIVAEERATLPPGERTFVARVPTSLDVGEYRVQVRLAPAGGGPAITDAIRLTVRTPSGGDTLGPPLLLRRGPSTGNAVRVTADPRFRRNEWLRAEAPIDASLTDVSAVLSGRNGQPLRVPVAVERVARGTAGGEGEWVVAQVALSPLAPGDYAITIEGRSGDRVRRVVAPFRVVP